MKILERAEPLRPVVGLGLGLLAVAAFHFAYAPGLPSGFRLLSLLVPALLIQLARLPSRRWAFYTGLGIGLLCVGPELYWLWNIFGTAAIPLWLILSLWTALFLLLSHRVLERFGSLWSLILIPCLWTGLEYFRSELYFLKFSWLNVGYAAGQLPSLAPGLLGMYGIGFAAAALGSAFLTIRHKVIPVFLGLAALTAFVCFRPVQAATGTRVHIAGVQLEFPNQAQLLRALDQVIARSPEAELIVASEYTLDGPVPDALRRWCSSRNRYLILGGKDPGPAGSFYNTAFVINPHGEIVHKQAKSVPIQFFKDGLPARTQTIWESPWGKMGICICYDLSYTRVTDALVRSGAQWLVVPTMDVESWGKWEHQLHALVAPVRAGEYGIPIFRVASSGISQAVGADGRILARTGFPGQNEVLCATLEPSRRGTLPMDRYLGPVCVGITIATVIALTVALVRSRARGELEWRENRPDVALWSA